MIVAGLEVLQAVSYTFGRVTYSEAIQFLLRLQLFGARLGLDVARQLATAAGNPQEKLRFIHVAGTNGKGSTCAMLEAIYRSAGLRVGLYTSPHLVSFRERLQVDRQLIDETDVVRLVGECQRWMASLAPDACPTFFEVITIIALSYFAEQRCDIVIWETGLGGRLDATNIVLPLATVITNIQLDHQKWLGNTIEQIAREKAGIIKPRTPVITAAEEPDALRVIGEVTAQSAAPLHRVSAKDAAALALSPALAGTHQRLNAALALRTVEVLRPILPVSDEAVRNGLQHVEWAGRFQKVTRGEQTIVLDGAHNPAGAVALAQTVRHQFPGKRCALVVGVLDDKDWRTVCSTLAPLAQHVVLSPVSSPRTADPQELADACRQANPTAKVVAAKSFEEALAQLAGEPLVIVTGSLYFVGEAMERLGLGSAAGERQLNDYWKSPSLK